MTTRAGAAASAHAAIAAPAFASLTPPRRQPRHLRALLSRHYTLLREPVEPGQDTSFDYTQTLTDHRVLQSVGSVGDAYDNAMAESFVDSFKTELIADRVWRTRAQLELAVVEYIGWFSQDRLHSALDYRSPADYEHQSRQSQTEALSARTATTPIKETNALAGLAAL